MKYKYILEPYSGSKSRYFCPNCNKKEYVRYLDTLSNEHLPMEFGRCNRQIKCGYFRKPSDNKKIADLSFGKALNPKPKIEFLNSNLIQNSKYNNGIVDDPLFQYVCNYFEKLDVIGVFRKYQVKSQNLRNEVLTLFPQLDNHKKLRALKKMKYNPETGKRNKSFFRWHNPERLTLKQCLFGLHLINDENFINVNEVYIVESEKTALIASLSNDNALFMATGGLANLTKDRLRPLVGKRVILIPDLAPDSSVNTPYKLWKEKGERISKELNIDLSVCTRLLEISNDSQKEQQWDLADFILYNKKRSIDSSINSCDA